MAKCAGWGDAVVGSRAGGAAGRTRLEASSRSAREYRRRRSQDDCGTVKSGNLPTQHFAHLTRKRDAVRFLHHRDVIPSHLNDL